MYSLCTQPIQSEIEYDDQDEDMMQDTEMTENLGLLQEILLL